MLSIIASLMVRGLTRQSLFVHGDIGIVWWIPRQRVKLCRKELRSYIDIGNITKTNSVRLQNVSNLASSSMDIFSGF